MKDASLGKKKTADPKTIARKEATVASFENFHQ
jgi:hypothetical protein